MSLLFFGTLNFAIPSENALSEFIVNSLGMFFATNLVCLREYIQGETRSVDTEQMSLIEAHPPPSGVPAIPGLIPILLILAPGSSVLIDILKGAVFNP